MDRSGRGATCEERLAGSSRNDREFGPRIKYGLRWKQMVDKDLRLDNERLTRLSISKRISEYLL